LFVEYYQNKKHAFQIIYTDDSAEKIIFKYEGSQIIDTTKLVASVDNSKIPFDSLDVEIFRKLKEVITNNDGIIYKMKWTDYNGYYNK